jgi:hypothetical protein
MKPRIVEPFPIVFINNSCTFQKQSKGSATQKAGCRGGQAGMGNRGGLLSGDARQGAAAKSGPV